jgi:hypothetical protein
MRLPEGEKDLLARAVDTSYTVKIDLNFSCRTAVSERDGQGLRPFANKLAIQDNPDPVAPIEDSGLQHDREKCTRRSTPAKKSTLFRSITYKNSAGSTDAPAARGPAGCPPGGSGQGKLGR